MEKILSDSFFTRRAKKFRRTDGIKLYGKLGVEFSFTSELLHPNMKFRLWLITTRPQFYITRDNTNVGIVDCSLNTCRTALKDDYHKKRMDMLPYTIVKFNLLETLPKTFIITARQSTSFKETFLALLQLVELPLQWKQTLIYWIVPW